MTAAAYGRNSKPPKNWKPTEDQPEPPGSYRQQLAKCERFAVAAEEALAVQEFDVASGGNANRPAWSRIMSGVRGGTIHRVYATKLDRVARNLAHFLAIAAEFERRGAELVFTDQPAASIRKADPAGKAMRNMLATFAEFELDLIRERSGAVMSIGEDGRTYGPRSDKPAGRPREFADGHKLRKRGSAMVHDRARCAACRGETGGVGASVSAPPQTAGVAEPVGLTTPERPILAVQVAGSNSTEAGSATGNVEVAADRKVPS